MRPNWAERFVDRLKRSPFLVLFFFASLTVSACVVLVDAGIRVHRWYGNTYEWRDREYAKLTNLKAGFALARFRESLGSPVFSRPVASIAPRPIQGPALLGFSRARPAQGLTESSFRGPGYWVQAISDPNGMVVAYAVTSCDPDFRPTFSAPYEAFKATLNVSTFAQVIPWRRTEGLISHYFPSGATANSSFFDFLYGGNPLDYKSFAWGLNDACEGWFDRYEGFFDRGLIPLRTGQWWEYHGRTREGGREVRRFRAAVRINTYAETAPARWDVDLSRSRFQVGVDRILVRTLWEQS